jgi:hypothetical protein
MTRIQSRSWRARAAVVSAIAIPVVFVGIVFAWAKVDESLGLREVSQYIRDHQSVVTERLKNQKVHSFSLTHLPSQPATLLIQFDVDDKATYEMLESDLDDIWGMRFPPMWETKLRSSERLSNNYGYAGLGFGELGKGMTRFLIAGIASLVPVTFFTVLALCHARRSRPSYPSKAVTTEL